MAVIDTFLTLMVNQKADKLVVRPDDVPLLIKADETVRLSMPAVSAEMVALFAEEVVGEEPSKALKERSCLEGEYGAADGKIYRYRVQSRGTCCEIEMSSSQKEVSDGDAAVRATPEDIVDAGEASISEADIPVGVSAEDVSCDVQVVETATASMREPVSTSSAADTLDAVPDSTLRAIAREAQREGASDIFLSSERRPHLRVNGIIEPMAFAVTRRDQIEQLVSGERLKRELQETGSVDFGVTWDLSEDHSVSSVTQRFRANVFRHAHGVGAALRLVKRRIPSLDDLHLPSDLYRLCDYASGLVLVTGATGSGKSTTLASLLDYINRKAPRHIITIEDPIEFEHRNQKAIVHQREVNTHVESFSAGLRAALRENPDVILVGEMRDLPTIAAALTASETGHLVFSTLHTGNATTAINRIIDAFPGHQQSHVRIQIASSLRAVVAQRLVPSAGNQSRLPAIEKLIVTHGVANLIREGREHQVESAIQTGGDDGMITLERSLATLARRRLITRSTAVQYAENRFAIQKLLGD